MDPHYESISSDDKSHTSPIYPPEKQVPFPWEVSLAFAPGYLRIDPKLLDMVYEDKEKMTEQECPPRRNSTEKPPHPFYIVDGGPLNYFIDLATIILLESDRRSLARR